LWFTDRTIPILLLALAATLSDFLMKTNDLCSLTIQRQDLTMEACINFMVMGMGLPRLGYITSLYVSTKFIK